MKQIITKYFCNRCSNELKHAPAALMSFRQDTYGFAAPYSLDVTIAYVCGDIAADESHLCPKCKLYALNEAKKILEHELAEEQKGEQK